MAWYVYPAIIAAGFIAGFINTLAGSGSLITLPVLIFLGLPATVANGTNRVGILLQNIVGLGGFHRQDMLDLRGTIILGLPAIAGSLVGAQIAVNLDEEMMRRAIGLLMVVMLVVILVRPNRWLKGELTRLENWPGWSRMLLFFAIGIYGGFIQAGVGIFLLAGLVLGVGYEGMELALGFHAANNLVTALLVTADWTAFQTDSILKDVAEPGLSWDAYIPIFVVFPLLLYFFGRKYGWTNWKERLTGRVLSEEEARKLLKEDTSW
jgi:uncharacterized membrane protein YfcA